jgi:hypothetical protein
VRFVCARRAAAALFAASAVMGSTAADSGAVGDDVPCQRLSVSTGIFAGTRVFISYSFRGLYKT